MSKESIQQKSFSQRLGSGMITLAWIVLLGLLTLYFKGVLQQQHNPNINVISSSSTDHKEVILKRNRIGHYVANGQINDHPVEFILDTGASMVSVPETLAKSLGLKRGPVMDVSTANGTISVYFTWLDRVQLGNIVLTDIRASINPYMSGNEVLLGMSFLKKLEFTQRGELLMLRQYE